MSEAKTELWLDQQWIIWNGAFGIRDFVMIDRIEMNPSGLQAWLEEPYDMVGPFSMDELAENGKISFAECIVMSRECWLNEQQMLREASFIRQQKTREKVFEELRKRNRHRQVGRDEEFNELHCRELLALPKEGLLEHSQIKKAFRHVAKEAHPDVGGSHEHFVEITKAKEQLLSAYGHL
jgi:hypothetical protein